MSFKKAACLQQMNRGHCNCGNGGSMLVSLAAVNFFCARFSGEFKFGHC
jgi:hypothetical protein